VAWLCPHFLKLRPGLVRHLQRVSQTQSLGTK
jgi:hypothetical protein